MGKVCNSTVKQLEEREISRIYKGTEASKGCIMQGEGREGLRLTGLEGLPGQLHGASGVDHGLLGASLCPLLGREVTLHCACEQNTPL